MIDREKTGLGVNNNIHIESTDKEYKISIMHSVGDVVFQSTDEDIFTVDSNGLITPFKDGAAILKIHDDEAEDYLIVLVSAYGEIYKELDDYLKEIPEEKSLKYVKEFKNYSKEENLNGLIGDYIYAEFWEEDKRIFVDIDFDEEMNIINLTPSKSFEIKNEDSYVYESIKHNKAKEIKLKYAEFNSEDEKIVSEFGKSVKEYYNSYLNKSYEDMFKLSNKNNQELMLMSTPIYKEIKKLGIDYIIDARYGDDTPGKALYGGQLVLGKNGVYYGIANIEVRQILLIPTVEAGKNLLDAIREYFVEYFLKESEEVKIEQIDDEKYRAIVTEKKDTSILGLIGNFFIPKVYADNEKVIEFSVEQTNEKIDSKLEELISIEKETPKEEVNEPEENKTEEIIKNEVDETKKEEIQIENENSNETGGEIVPETGDNIIIHIIVVLVGVLIIIIGLKKIITAKKL